MTELLFKDEVYAIVGAALEVHRCLGSGFLEPVYQEALEVEYRIRELPFEAQKPWGYCTKTNLCARSTWATSFTMERSSLS